MIPTEALTHFLGGFVLGVALAAPPGPVMAIMAQEAIRGRTGRSMVTAFGAMTGDAIWLSLTALGFITFLSARPNLVGVMGLAGALLLVYLAWGAYKSARAGVPSPPAPAGGSARETFTRGSYKVGLVTVLTSPFSFAWWFANGAILLDKWGMAGIAGLFLALVVVTLTFTFGMKWAGARFKNTIVAVAYVSAVLLAGFGLYVAWESLGYFGA